FILIVTRLSLKHLIFFSGPKLFRLKLQLYYNVLTGFNIINSVNMQRVLDRLIQPALKLSYTQAQILSG
ncbi:MAG: hypothetical protein OEZ36_11420, partial [Spirochaetota bacterium]|nr:hypothetical protein [Spirochaetota bacterium]